MYIISTALHKDYIIIMLMTLWSDPTAKVYKHHQDPTTVDNFTFLVSD
jgi:hypothetical protein